MYIFLARQNVQIYLFGGLMLALIGIFSVAYANYVEDRRTLALLRIRGAGPADVVRFFLPNVFGPSLIGLIVGALISLGVGFGITKLVWDLRQLQTVMSYLPTRLAVSEQTGIIALAPDRCCWSRSCSSSAAGCSPAPPGRVCWRAEPSSRLLQINCQLITRRFQGGSIGS